MSVISQFVGGGVKSVQSGAPSASGTATISAVNLAKSFITSVSKASTVTQGTTNITPNSITGGQTGGGGGVDPINLSGMAMPTYAAPGAVTAVTSRSFSAKLTNSTTVTFDGACEWQVVEYY